MKLPPHGGYLKNITTPQGRVFNTLRPVIISSNPRYIVPQLQASAITPSTTSTRISRHPLSITPPSTRFKGILIFLIIFGMEPPAIYIYCKSQV
ncbi:MAG: hypothetical protein HQK63_08770 [Desulfamplus sp.]|nr:hypothetical protein [Desulfamplus sp.]